MELIHFNSVVFFQLLLLSFCLVFEFFSINCNVLGQCLQIESSALLQLKRGFTSGDLDTWQLSTNCCIWEGVTCDESSGRVIGLDLSNRFIAGMIDPSLFNLTSLRALNFANNQFHGDLEFEFIKYLKNLTSLDLSNSGLSLNSWDAYNGNFLSSFPKISYLAIASCNLAKIPAIINYPHMMGYLDLSNNRINGEIPSWFWRIPKLNLSCNMFTHVADSPLNVDTYYYNYSFIDLHSNMLESQILPLPLTNHRLLDFSNNRFTSFISFNISSHQNSLQYLFLANNSMTGEIPPFICNMTKLVVLDLSNNKLTGSIPSCLLKGVDLQVLKIRGNQLHGAIPNEISPKCELQIINLRDNQLDELIPRSLSNCKSLEIMDLKETLPNWLGNSCCA